MTKRLLIILTALTLGIATQSHAQSVFFKIGGGLSAHFNGHDTDHHAEKSRPVGSFKIGVGYEYEFDQQFSFSPGIYFHGMGWKGKDIAVTYDDDINPDTGNPREGLMNTSASANYIELAAPFNYYVRVGEGHYLVFYAGPYVGYGVNGKYKIKGDPTRTGGERICYQQKAFKDITDMKRLDVGILVGAGYQFSNGITAGIEANVGCVEAYKATGARNIGGLISLSYNFHQGKRAHDRLVDDLWKK